MIIGARGAVFVPEGYRRGPVRVPAPRQVAVLPSCHRRQNLRIAAFQENKQVRSPQLQAASAADRPRVRARCEEQEALARARARAPMADRNRRRPRQHCRDAQASAAQAAQERTPGTASMQWFQLPPKVYFKPGSLETALGDLRGKRVRTAVGRPRAAAPSGD
jgi:hypothetical protein